MSSPEHALIDRSVRCVACHAPLGGCACHDDDAPAREARAKAKAAAPAVAGAVLAEMARLYPEPMRYASGGFRKTLRGVIEHEVARALMRAAGFDVEEAERKSLADAEALIARFRRQQAGGAP